MLSRLAPLVALSFTACLHARPMLMGAPAMPLGRGSTDVSVGAGVGYVQQSNPVFTSQGATPSEVLNTFTKATGFALPTVEGNVQYGFSKRLALNAHVSPAGLQPGLRINLTNSRLINLAIMPTLGAGYASVLDSTFSGGQDGRYTESGQRLTTSFTFLAGAKFSIAHQSGFYLAVGYDLLLNRSRAMLPPTTSSDRSDVTTTSVQHQLSGNIGFEIAMGEGGVVKLRPEVSVAVAPMSNTVISVVGANTSTANGVGGLTWAIVPGITIGVQSPPTKKVAAEQNDRREERDQLREDETEDAEEEEEAPRRRRRSEGLED